LFEFVVTSQAAYKPETEVSCLLSTTKHNSSSFSKSKPSTIEVFGSEPIATNIQLASRVFPDLSFTQVIQSTSQVISPTSSFRTNSIFPFAFTFSTQESSALKVSLL